MYLDELKWEQLDDDRVYRDLGALLSSADIRYQEEDVRAAIIANGQTSVLSFWNGVSLCRYDVRSRFSDRKFDLVLALRVPEKKSDEIPQAVKNNEREPFEQTELFLLDGKSNAIYDTHDRVGIVLTPETVIDYLKFFCFAVHGDEGAFNLVERPSDLVPNSLEKDDPERERLERLGRMLGKVVLDPARDDEGRFRLRSAVKYGSSVFQAEFAVTAVGQPEMLGDNPVAEKVPLDRDLGIPALDITAVTAEVRERPIWVGLRGDAEPTRDQVLAALTEVGKYGDGEWQEVLAAPPAHVEIKQWAQRFIRAGEILRVSFTSPGGQARSCVFLWQRVLGSWPAMVPLSGHLENLYAYCDELGMDAALEAHADSWKHLAAFVTSERQSSAASGEARATVYLTFADLPLQLQERVCRAIKEWTPVKDPLYGSPGQVAILDHVAASAARSALARDRPKLFRAVTDFAKELRERFEPDESKNAESALERDDSTPTFSGIDQRNGRARSRTIGFFVVAERAVEGDRVGLELFVDCVRVLTEPPKDTREASPRTAPPKDRREASPGDVKTKIYRLAKEKICSWEPRKSRPSPSMAPVQSTWQPTQQSRQAFRDRLRAAAAARSTSEMTVKEVAELIKAFRALDLSGVVIKGDLRVCARPSRVAESTTDSLSRPEVGQPLRHIRLENCRIEGHLDLDGVTVEGECTLRDVFIKDGLTLCGASFERNVQLVRVTTGEAEAALSVKNTRIKGGISLQSCCFDGQVMFRYMETTYFWPWGVWAKGFAIQRSTIRGSVSTFSTAEESPEPFGIRCDWYFQLAGIKVQGILRLASVSVEGSLSLDQVDVEGKTSIGEFDSTTFEITAPSRIGGDLEIKNCHFNGDLELNNCLVKRFSMSQSRVSQFLVGGDHGSRHCPLGHGAVLGDLELFESTVSGAVRCRALDVMRTVRIERCQLGHVDFDGQLGSYNGTEHRFLLPTRVKEGVEIRGSHIAGSIQFLASHIKRETEHVQPAFEVSSSTVGKHLMFWTGRYCENINLTSIAEAFKDSYIVPEIETYQEAGLTYSSKGILTRFARPGWLVRPEEPGKERSEGRGEHQPKGFENLEDKSLDRADRERLRLRRTAARVETRVDGQARINQCQIQGDVRISNLRAQDGIELRELRVSGNVRADSVDDRYGRWDIGFDPADRADRADRANPATKCRSLILTSSRIEGHVDLTGLVAGFDDPLAQPINDVSDWKDEPALRIADTTVDKIVSLISKRPKDKSAGRRNALPDRGSDHREQPVRAARLGRRVDLTGSTFGTVRVSGSIWKHAVRASDPKPETFYVALKASEDIDPKPEPLLNGHGASFGALEFVQDLPELSHARPPIDLLDATVKTWAFPGLKEKPLDTTIKTWGFFDSPKAQLGFFLAQMLSRTKPREGVYYQVESYLKDVGHPNWSKRIARDAVWRRRCKDLCDALPNPTRLKGVLRQKKYVAISDGSTLGLRQVAPIRRVIGLGLLSLMVCAVWPARRTGARNDSAATRPMLGLDSLPRIVAWTATSVPVLQFVSVLPRFWFPATFALFALPFLFPEVRAYGLLFGSVVNRMVTGNFTSPGRAAFLLVALYATATAFFQDVDHLDISSLYKKNYYEDAKAKSETKSETEANTDRVTAPLAAIDSGDETALVCGVEQPSRREPSLSPPTPLQPGVYRAEPNRVTLDVCNTLGQWGWGHAFLFATRFMLPVLPSMFDEIDIDNATSPHETPDRRLECVPLPAEPALARCCAIANPWLGGKWPSETSELRIFHDWRVLRRFHDLPVPWVALFIRIVSGVLLTMLGWTLAQRFTRGPE